MNRVGSEAQPVGSPSRYLAVFRLDSGARISANGLGPPGVLQITVHGPDGTHVVTILDLFVEEGTGPTHIGIGVEVELDAADLDDAVTKGKSLATFAATLLSATAQAFVGPPLPVVAFQRDSHEGKRYLRRWFRELDLSSPTRRVVPAMLTQVAERVLEAPGALGFRLRTSLQVFREAMNHESDVWRFLSLWISAEALDASLKAHYRSEGISVIGGKRYPGLQTLEREANMAPFIREVMKGLGTTSSIAMKSILRLRSRAPAPLSRHCRP